MRTKSQPMSFRMYESEKKRLQRFCELEEVHVASVIREAIRQFLDSSIESTMRENLGIKDDELRLKTPREIYHENRLKALKDEFYSADAFSFGS